MKRIKRYNGEEGSSVEPDEMKPAQRIEFSESTESTGPAKSMSFKEAFASARGAGDKTFEWQGKKYTTDLASPKSSRAAEPAPKSARVSESASKSVAKIDSASAPMARSIKSDLDELSKSNSSLGNVNMLSKGKMSPEKKEEVIKSTPKRSGYSVPKSSEFTGMGGMKFGKGGSVSSASKRADGCAERGKTRGKMI
jgi:hypothetical protein